MRLLRLRGSVRARTTIAAVAAVIPVLIVAGVAGVLLQRHDLTNAVAAIAEEQARSISREVSTGSIDLASPDPAASLPLALRGDETAVQIVSTTDGTVLASSTAVEGTPLLGAPGPAGSRREVTGDVGGEPDRYMAVAVPVQGKEMYVVVARSLESVDATAASSIRLILAGGAFVLVVVGALTWFATGLALAPVEAMRRRAAEISAEDLDARLPEPAGQDDLGRLATTLNELLARRQQASEDQRRFVADASHELRSPVAAIRTLIESDRIAPHPGGAEGLSDDILEETARLSYLVDDLLALAAGRERAGRSVERLDLADLAHVEGRRARAVPVSVDAQSGVIVEGDREVLAHAVRNLLDNAERHATERVGIHLRSNGDTVDLVISDDGPGIPESQRERVFDRFVRLDDARNRSDGGAGLGLAIVRQSVAAHGGTVTITGADPVGTEVVITLPVTDRAP